MKNRLANFKMNFILIIISLALIVATNTFMFSYSSGMMYGLCLLGIIVLSIICLISTKDNLKLSCNLAVVVGIGAILSNIVESFIEVPVWDARFVVTNFRILFWFSFINGILVLINGIKIKGMLSNPELLQQNQMNNVVSQSMNNQVPTNNSQIVEQNMNNSTIVSPVENNGTQSCPINNEVVTNDTQQVVGQNNNQSVDNIENANNVEGSVVDSNSANNMTNEQ